MTGFRNFIARRRPVSVDLEDGVRCALSNAPHIKEDQTKKTGSATEESRLDGSELELARAARDYIPAPQPPQPHRYPDWEKPQKRLFDPMQTLDAHETASHVSAPKIWDLELKASAPETDEAELDECVLAPEENTLAHDLPARMTETSAGRPHAERTKTRLLGFHGASPVHDVFADKTEAPIQPNCDYPIGWIVILEGPGRGASFTLGPGLSTIGRDSDQTVALNFGDTSISRKNHVSIAYEEEENTIYVGHGGKQNIVRLNAKPLLSTEELHGGDRLIIGKTELLFVGMCGDDFAWHTATQEDANDD